MHKWQDDVRRFMERAEQRIPDKVMAPPDNIQILRERLINEEAKEFAYAQVGGNPVTVADAIADLLYVTLGAAVAWGIDIEPVFEEVHAANMRKFDGGHRREDGKWMKPLDWVGPDLASILRRQMD